MHEAGANGKGRMLNWSYNDVLKDLKQSSQILGGADIYCYPFGQYNENLINSWKSSDGLLAFAYGPTRKDYRKSSRKDDNYKIPRLNVSHGMKTWKLGLRLLFGN